MTSGSVSRQTCEHGRVWSGSGIKSAGANGKKGCLSSLVDASPRPNFLRRRAKAHPRYPDRVAADVEVEDPASTIDCIVPLRPGCEGNSSNSAPNSEDGDIQSDLPLQKRNSPHLSRRVHGQKIGPKHFSFFALRAPHETIRPPAVHATR
jgi:hypothetical protein